MFVLFVVIIIIIKIISIYIIIIILRKRRLDFVEKNKNKNKSLCEHSRDMLLTVTVPICLNNRDWWKAWYLDIHRMVSDLFFYLFILYAFSTTSRHPSRSRKMYSKCL